MAYSRGRCLLQYWLDHRNITQADFARRIGWSPRMVSFWCKDERLMSVEAMYAASVILEIHMEQLYQWRISAE
ncbi:helix-turn-helix transcriptional regulator [Paenibacillus dokdonensis]|uniref:Helix-turn-helix transcriptional regulator n=1 Tax=Paenibacillus dokdonensis TaxID=2567944 RepID=A0ABU6GJ75_9BACL|nr:helix-turn-helix transcriptional regulator [Paenibacillus dokdonensis]MEC0239444.1 helix-turn-helix transcriptional regulator [Paenibacillus dokdonensis]